MGSFTETTCFPHPQPGEEEGHHWWLGALRVASDHNLSVLPNTHPPTYLPGLGAPQDLKPLGGHMVRGNQVPERSNG